MRLASLCIVSASKLCKAAERVRRDTVLPLRSGQPCCRPLDTARKVRLAPRWMRFCATGVDRIAAGGGWLHVATFARFAHRSIDELCPLSVHSLDAPTVALRRGQGRLLLEPAQRKALSLPLRHSIRCCGGRPIYRTAQWVRFRLQRLNPSRAVAAGGSTVRRATR